MNRLPLLTFLFLTPLVASFGCSSSNDTDGESQTTSSSADLTNGWQRQVSLDGGEVGSRRYALGETSHFTVTDQARGPSTCTSTHTNGCSAATCTTPTEETSSTIVSVACDGCTATTTRVGPGTFDVDVTSTVAGTSTLTMSLADPNGVVLTTTASIISALPTAVTLTRSAGDAPNGTTYAVLPGAAFNWCASLTDDVGPLFFDANNLAIDVTGAAHYDALPVSAGPRVETCFEFDADAPGDIVFRATNPHLVRTETLHVLAPSDITRVELLVGPTPSYAGQEIPVETDPLAGLTVSSRVTMDSCSAQSTRIALRAFTSDGRAALAFASLLDISPSLVSEVAALTPSSELIDLQATASGPATITAAIGTASLSVPLVVTGDCLPSADAPDAGADAGGDY